MDDLGVIFYIYVYVSINQIFLILLLHVRFCVELYQPGKIPEAFPFLQTLCKFHPRPTIALTGNVSNRRIMYSGHHKYRHNHCIYMHLGGETHSGQTTEKNKQKTIG